MTLSAEQCRAKAARDFEIKAGSFGIQIDKVTSAGAEGVPYPEYSAKSAEAIDFKRVGRNIWLKV